MIKYHGLPFSGSNSEAAEALIGRHAFVSFASPSQLQVALDVCQSVALDNGAFSAWKSEKVIDWDKYFLWAESLARNPRIDWAVIPDVIDGNENDNLKLIERWNSWFKNDAFCYGVPVWHMHESEAKLLYLMENYKRIAIGSSSEFQNVGSDIWHERMHWAMNLICDENGYPRVKIHMLRGLDVEIFTKYPFSSADSTNAGRNCMGNQKWSGTYAPPSNSWRSRVIMARIESCNSSQTFESFYSKNLSLF